MYSHGHSQSAIDLAYIRHLQRSNIVQRSRDSLGGSSRLAGLIREARPSLNDDKLGRVEVRPVIGTALGRIQPQLGLSVVD